MTITDLHDLGGQVFECNKVRRTAWSDPGWCPGTGGSARPRHPDRRDPSRLPRHDGICLFSSRPVRASPHRTLPVAPASPPPRSFQAHGDALIRAFSTKKYPRLIVVKDALIVSVKVDDRGFVVHKWTKKIVDLKQVYLVVKDNRRVYQLALEFNQRPGEKKPFTDVLQFNPTTSRDFTQTISRMRKELLGNRRPGAGAEASPARRDESSAARASLDRHAPPAHTAHDPPERQQRQSAFRDAIANANAQRFAQPGMTPVPAPAPAPAAPVSDPFAQNPFSAPVPPPAHSPTRAGPESVGGSVTFDNMMQSVAANGHQMETLFSPAPSQGAGAVADPFAAMAAPAQPPQPQQAQQQQMTADPFAMGTQPSQMQPMAPQQMAANPFAPAAAPAQVSDPFAAMPTQANPFAAPAQPAPAPANPFAAAPYQPPQQQQNNPFA